MVKKHKKLLFFLVFVAIVVGGIILFIALNSTPDRLTEEERNQAVADILGRKPNIEDTDTKTGNTLFDGETIFFEYPAKAVVYDYEDPGKENNESNIETFSFDLENPRLVFNFTAMRKPNLRNIEDEPSVKLREDSSRGYEIEESFMIDNTPAAVYKKEGGGPVKAEKTAYVLRDGILYTLSITGASLEDVEELFEVVISSTEFQ